MRSYSKQLLMTILKSDYFNYKKMITIEMNGKKKNFGIEFFFFFKSEFIKNENCMHTEF